MNNSQTTWRRVLRRAEQQNDVNFIFKEMLALNIKFIRGELLETPSHLGPLDEESEPLIPALLELNSLGMFTTNSQPGYDAEGVRQRGEVDGLILSDIAHDVEAAFALRDDGVFATFSQAKAFHDVGEWSTVPTIVITTDRGEPFTRAGIDPGLDYWLGFDNLRRTTLEQLATHLIYIVVVDSFWGRETAALDAALQIIKSV